MIKVTIKCDRTGCDASTRFDAKNENEVLTLLKKSGFNFISRPDSKQQILLCSQCQQSKETLEATLNVNRKAAYGEFFEGNPG